MTARHLLINGLSIGGGGGYTVGRELTREIGRALPAWRLSLALIEGFHWHEMMRREAMPENVRLHWAPPSTAGRLARWRYERGELVAWATQNRVNALLQLNGMPAPRFHVPTLHHFQDPWPFVPLVWSGTKDRLTAMIKRRRIAQSLRSCRPPNPHNTGWTSRYLRDLVCSSLGIKLPPERAEIFYNGVPREWHDRTVATNGVNDLEARPLELVTVSNVARYKRHDLVIRALPQVMRAPGLERLVYRIVGHVDPGCQPWLEGIARDAGVADRVIFEGRVSDERVEQAFLSARCFVLMSVCESFGIPMIEAMSFGTPVVTANCCAMPEVCGDAAELCPPDDVNALAERLITVLSNRGGRGSDLQRRGFARVRAFSWQRTGRDMARAISEMTE